MSWLIDNGTQRVKGERAYHRGRGRRGGWNGERGGSRNRKGRTRAIASWVRGIDKLIETRGTRDEGQWQRDRLERNEDSRETQRRRQIKKKKKKKKKPLTCNVILFESDSGQQQSSNSRIELGFCFHEESNPTEPKY